MKKTSTFSRMAKSAAKFTGRPLAFNLALGIVILWIVTGPIFRFSDTWQLVINTGTTIVTFLMVFLIQNSQNRDTAAIQIKLDEIIRATKGAHNALLDLEELEEDDIEKFRLRYCDLASKARKTLSDNIDDTGAPELWKTADEAIVIND